jgi:hypothetical protein
MKERGDSGETAARGGLGRRGRYARLLGGAVVTGFWLAMMVSLVRNHLLPARGGGEGRRLDVAGLAEDWRDLEEWMEVCWGGAPIGVAMGSVEALEGGLGFRLVSRASLELSAGPLKKSVRFWAVAKLDGDLLLDSFRVFARAGPGSLDLNGFVWEDRLCLKFWSPTGALRRAYWPLEEPISLLEALRPLAARRIDLEEGATYRVAAFDPIWFGRAGEAKIEVLGRETIEVGGRRVEATRVVTTLAGQRTTSWVGEDRSVLRYEILEGLTLEATDRERVLARHPDFATKPALPQFDVEEFAYNLELIDLSQGSPLESLGRLLGP